MAFVDDNFIQGNSQASRNFSLRLEESAEYKEPFRPLALGAIEHALGIEGNLTVTPLFVKLRISQGDHGRLCVGRFEEVDSGRLSKRFSDKRTPGFHDGRMKVPSHSGVLGDVARS